jgi:hypothetical protein
MQGIPCIAEECVGDGTSQTKGYGGHQVPASGSQGMWRAVLSHAAREKHFSTKIYG